MKLVCSDHLNTPHKDSVTMTIQNLVLHARNLVIPGDLTKIKMKRQSMEGDGFGDCFKNNKKDYVELWRQHKHEHACFFVPQLVS